MATLGLNIRCVAGQSHRDAISRFYREVFGADTVHPAEDLDVYVLGGTACIGVYFVADDQALTPQQHEAVGTWIEITVGDVEQVRAQLKERGVQELTYRDQEHHYFAAPGGQVFRLAAA